MLNSVGFMYHTSLVVCIAARGHTLLSDASSVLLGLGGLYLVFFNFMNELMFECFKVVVAFMSGTTGILLSCVLVSQLKFKKIEGSPDGMTTDSNNNLWVCHYRAAKISVYNRKGNKIHQISIPAKNITNCTFGGHNNNKLFISTALQGMKYKDLKRYPLSGGLFAIQTNTKGKKAISFKSSLLNF